MKIEKEKVRKKIIDAKIYIRAKKEALKDDAKKVREFFYENKELVMVVTTPLVAATLFGAISIASKRRDQKLIDSSRPYCDVYIEDLSTGCEFLLKRPITCYEIIALDNLIGQGHSVSKALDILRLV